jgi:N-acetylmuramoyl-L-alanine amidase
MIKQLFIALVLGLTSLQVHSAPVPTVEKVRLGQHGDTTRVVLESTRPLDQTHFTLPSPARFVMDFKTLKFASKVSAVKLPKHGLVDGIRQGNFKPGVVRMVLDLKKPVVSTVFTIPKNREKGHRLVIDLKPATDAQIKSRTKEIKQAAKKRSQRDIPVFTAAPKVKDETFVVVVDPGHGGVDPGAIGKRKTYEKHVTLQIAKKLKRELEKRKNVKVYLTRYKDVFVPLKDRVRIAQRRHADLFISLHADAHRNRKVRGGSVYVLSDRASDKEAARLARHANEGDIIAGIDLSHESKDVQNILLDLTQRETMNKSALLAKEVISTMRHVVHLRKKKIMFAGFRVLKAPDVPSILVEMSYLSNLKEEKLLKNSSSQTKIARAIANGVDGYMKKHMHN